MNDIVERARRVVELRGDTYSSYEIIGLIGQLADEIERLRGERASDQQRLLHYEAQIERLRSDATLDDEARLNAAKAEIERLEELIADRFDIKLKMAERIKELEAEIERLQAENTNYGVSITQMKDEAKELRDEVERLRDEWMNSAACG